MTLKIYSIYKATCTLNGKMYIGYSEDFSKRKDGHKACSKRKKNKENAFYKAIREFGWDNFTWEIIYEGSDSNHTMNVMEPYFIAEYHTYIDDPLCNGYNSTKGGGYSYGCAEETKRKISQANKGSKRTPEEKAKMSAWQLGLKRGPRPEETRKKISEAKTGNTIITEEWRRKISESSKGREPPNKGIPMPEEIILKHCKRWLIIFSDGHEEEIVNLEKFCREHNLIACKLALVARGKRKQHKGFKAIFLGNYV